jgi:hypothetical protein
VNRHTRLPLIEPDMRISRIRLSETVRGFALWFPAGGMVRHPIQAVSFPQFAFSCGFLNCCPYWLFSSVSQPLPYAYGVPVLQPKVAVARPLPWDHIPPNLSTPTGLRPMRRSPIRHGRNRFAVQSALHSFPGWASFHSADPGLEAVSPSGWADAPHSATFLRATGDWGLGTGDWGLGTGGGRGGRGGRGGGDRQTSLVRLNECCVCAG